MNTSKIIKGVVGGGRYTVTAPIIKEDYGLYLRIEGVELPETYQVDFSNDEHHGTSVTMIGNSDGVLIPSQFISSGKDVFAFLYHVGDDFGRTVYKFRIPNKLRPDRTNIDPTPEEQSVIDQAISALNTAVAQTAQDKADADASAQSTSADAERAEEAKTDAQNFAAQAEQSEQNAYTYALSANGASDTALQSAELAQTLANNAQASASASAQSASQASASEQGCARAVLDAASAAAIARARADEANGYTQTASTKASEASTKASEASASADLASRKASEITGLTAQANTLPSGSSATASYSNGTLTLGIPRGADGDDYVLTAQDKQDIAELVDVPVNDVQINGTSIVDENSVANVPIASDSKLGVVKTDSGYGIYQDNGVLRINASTEALTKAGTNSYKPIVPQYQHSATFYGLAKSAGDTTQSQSSNAVGTYTEEAKIAIQKMLGIYQAPWELIREDTFTNVEEADHIIDVDANGEAFELTELFLMFETPTQSTEAKKGSYGQVRYYYGETAGVSTETGAWTNAANAQGKALFGYIKIDGGLLFSAATQGTANGSAGNWRTRYSNGFAATGSMPQGIQYGDAIDSIKRINILAVTGTGHYKLYGRRKWQ